MHVQYTYEPNGRVRARTDQITVGTSQSNFTTSYAYDNYGRPTTLTYPSGQSVKYTWSSNQVSALSTTINGTTSQVLSSISYEPFGAVAGWTYGNGIVHSRGFDTSQRQTNLLTTAGATTLQSLKRRHFDSTAQKVGYAPTADPVIEDILARTPAAIAQVQAELPQDFSPRVAETILGGLERAATALAAMVA